MFFYRQVKEVSYKAHQELQLHLEYAKKPSQRFEPIHVHVAHQQELKKALARSESILQKLGNFAALVNEMIVQSVVMIIQQDVISYRNNVFKVKIALPLSCNENAKIVQKCLDLKHILTPLFLIPNIS